MVCHVVDLLTGGDRNPTPPVVITTNVTDMHGLHEHATIGTKVCSCGLAVAHNSLPTMTTTIDVIVEVSLISTNAGLNKTEFGV